MLNFDQGIIFTSAEVCRACGISKTSLFRLEECGFLKPYHVNPDTGYRYYNLQNITAIGQFQKLQMIGLSRTEIIDVYYDRVDSMEFVKTMRQKFNMMQRLLDEYEHHHSRVRSSSGSFVTLPAVTCYCKDFTAYSLEEAVRYNYCAHEECVEKGYRLNGIEPIFIVMDENASWTDLPVAGISYTICIPVDPDTEPGPEIRRFPEIQAFSFTGFGDYSVMPALGKKLNDEISKRKLVPSGPARIIMYVGAYTGTHFRSDDYCYEYVLPI